MCGRTVWWEQFIFLTIYYKLMMQQSISSFRVNYFLYCLTKCRWHLLCSGYFHLRKCMTETSSKYFSFQCCFYNDICDFCHFLYNNNNIFLSTFKMLFLKETYIYKDYCQYIIKTATYIYQHSKCYFSGRQISPIT